VQNAHATSVLVTGGSGFVGAHCVAHLLQAGYRVRTTVRALEREADVRAMLKTNGTEPSGRLAVVAADLMSDEGWPEAVAGCDYVLHVASPFPAGAPRHEDDLIVPAREGARRVLRAARDAGVKRVVMTSSFAAVGYSAKDPNEPYTEQDWTDPNADVGAYVKSKTLAERAAWELIAKEGGDLELAVINPVGIFGPVLGPDYSSSIQLVERLLDGAMPGTPTPSFGVVDVRDVADLHLRAMTDPAAKGERFIAVAGESVTMHEMARILKARLGDVAAHVPTRERPNWLIRVESLLNASLTQMVPELGTSKKISNEKAKRVLGWSPRSNEEAIVATGESLVRLGLLKDVDAGQRSA
jgi:nucleoside-diphosphate-sugar epimerase